MVKTLLFGLSLRSILSGVLVIAVFFAGTLWALDTLFPTDFMSERRPALTATAPLQPVARTSVIIAPVAVGSLAIRDVLEANAPRDLSGKQIGRAHV